jgi:chromate transporter
MSIEWLPLFQHFASVSLLAIGGAITTTSEMHRYLVEQRAWLTDAQFTSSIALAQAAPGPNILFVALLGWHVGLNAQGSTAHGLVPAMAFLGMTLSMLGILLPSSGLAYVAGQWAHRNRTRRAVRAFKAGMAPIVVALLLSTAWVLASAPVDATRDWRAWVLTAVSALIVWRTRLHLLWLLALGALLGATGLL